MSHEKIQTVSSSEMDGLVPSADTPTLEDHEYCVECGYCLTCKDCAVWGCGNVDNGTSD